MEIRVRSTGAVMFWNEFRDLLLSQNPSELITVAPQTEAWINAHGADIVYEGAQATGGTVYQYSMRQGVEQIGDKWHTKYVLGPIFIDTPAIEDRPARTAAENEVLYKAAMDAEQAANVRQQRNRRLAALDWTQGKDIPDSISSPAAFVRQGLRDVPNQEGFPWAVVWPDATE